MFIIDEKPHSVFKRDGNDLVVTQKISLVEALTGYTAQITTLDGRTLTVPVNSVINPSYEEVVKGEGMPIPKEPSRKGNLRIKFNIKFPTRLTSEQKTGIKRLLSSWMVVMALTLCMPHFILPFCFAKNLHIPELDNFWNFNCWCECFYYSSASWPLFMSHISVLHVWLVFDGQFGLCSWIF